MAWNGDKLIDAEIALFICFECGWLDFGMFCLSERTLNQWKIAFFNHFQRLAKDTIESVHLRIHLFYPSVEVASSFSLYA